MKKIVFLMFLCPLIINAQTNESIDHKNGNNDTTEIQIFYEELNLWIDSLRFKMDTNDGDEALMINDFVIFSEDGILMKDLKFHSLESCKQQIIKNTPFIKSGMNHMRWIYVSLESHVNKSELSEVLKFFKANNILYRFGSEDEFVKKISDKI